MLTRLDAMSGATRTIIVPVMSASTRAAKLSRSYPLSRLFHYTILLLSLAVQFRWKNQGNRSVWPRYSINNPFTARYSTSVPTSSPALRDHPVNISLCSVPRRGIYTIRALADSGSIAHKAKERRMAWAKLPQVIIRDSGWPRETRRLGL